MTSVKNSRNQDINKITLLKKGLRQGVYSGLSFGLLAFILALPILGIKLELSFGKMLLIPELLHALYAAMFIFFFQLLLKPLTLLWRHYWMPKSQLDNVLSETDVDPIYRFIYQIINKMNWFKKEVVLPNCRRGKIIVVPILVIAAMILPFIASRGQIDVATLAIIYILLGLGLNVVVGFAGLLDLGYVAFYAIGAYSYALLNSYYGLGFWYALPVAGLLAATMGVLLGFPVLRLRGDYLAIVTLGFGEIIRILLNNLDTITGGPGGISSIAKPTLFGLEFSRKASQGRETFHEFFGLTFQSEYRVIFLYFIGLCFVFITLYLINRLIRMPIGRAWEALREDEIACRSLGLNPTTIKLSAFAIGATFAGFAGAFFAAKQGFINPESFTFIESAIILAIVVLGGMGSQAGVIIAALALTILPELARSFASYRMLIFGLVMILMMIWRPQGLLPAKRPQIKVS